MPEATSRAGVAAPDDEALVRRARQGDRPASEELFRRHRGVVYRVAYRLLGHEQDALDAVQDGLLKAFSGLGDFDGRSGFRTWLIRVVTNAAIDLGRKRGRRSTLKAGPAGGHGQGQGWRTAGAGRDDPYPGGPEPPVEDDPARGLHRDDLRRALDAALDRLSPKLRTTFVLFAEAGLSYKEIAEVQAVPIGTVMSRLHEARQKLQAAPELQDLDGP
jgi:RNA polymerase sigma-70 factor (ECF subfamily)